MSTKKNAGVVTAYGAAVQAGYEGSYEDFCAEMADLGIQVGYLESMTVTVNILTPSSSASASYANGVLTLNIPRGNKGDKGNTGETPNLTIGTVTTGEPGSSAAATITGTAENPVLNLTIPEGEKGDTGNPGEVPAAAIAGTQASTTASKALAVGEHFWLNGTLYTATSPIASGGTIVTTGSGKNCDLAVIGDELASQSEKIVDITSGTKNIITSKISNAVIDSSGNMISYSGYDMFIAPVTQGTKYTYRTNDEAHLSGFFTSLPAIGSVTYNNSRYASVDAGDKIVESPVNGYIAVRTNGNYNAMIAEGYGINDYLPPVTANDVIARNSANSNTSDIESLSLETGVLMCNEYSEDMIPYDAYPYYTITNVAKGTFVKGINIYASASTKPPQIIFLKDTNGTLTIKHRRILNSKNNGWNYTELNFYCSDDYIIATNYFSYKVTAGDNFPKVISATGDTITSVTTGTRQLLCAIKLYSRPSTALNGFASVSMFSNGCVCGDSYSAGMIALSNPDRTVTNENMSWGKILGRHYGIDMLICAKGGITTKGYLTDADCLPKVLSNTAKEFYAISLGHNDMYTTDDNQYTESQLEEYIGSVDDLVGEYTDYPDNFIGNYAKIIEQIKTKASNAFIILLRQSRPYASLHGGAEINDAISSLGKHYNLPVFDPECDEFLNSDEWVALMSRNHPLFPGYSGLAESFAKSFSAYYQQYKDYYNSYGTA